MKKTVILFGILASTVFNTVSANTKSENRITKVNKTNIIIISPVVLAIVVKNFITYGTDIEQESKNGTKMTALMYDARYNQLDIVKISE